MGIRKKYRRKETMTRSRALGKTSSKVRVALFTHDTFGLGHVRRSLNILRGLSRELPQASLLLITGSPALSALGDLPQNTDCVKIPTVVKTGRPGSQPPHLPISVAETTLLRARIIRESVLAFAPDVFLVDNFPLGSQLELLPVLQALHPLPTKTILGLRDILDTPEAVCADWTRQGIYDVLERYYDRILIYGAKNVFDVVQNYRLSSSAAQKVRYCGYLTSAKAVGGRKDRVRRSLGIQEPFILVTGGGGGDAYPLIDAYIQSLPLLPDIRSLIVTGPLMGLSDRARLENKLNGNNRAVIRGFIPDLSTYFKAADLVLTMCGYNTAAEIMVQGPKAVVVPRTWKYGEHVQRRNAQREGEQLLRAQALARSGFVHLIEPERLQSQHLGRELSMVLNGRKKNPRVKINVQGLERTVAEIIDTALS